MKCINTNVYYFIPQIYNTYNIARSPHQSWYEYIKSQQLGILPFRRHDVVTNMLVRSADVSDYYRIVDSKLFIITCMRLNITIDDATPMMRPHHMSAIHHL